MFLVRGPRHQDEVSGVGRGKLGRRQGHVRVDIGIDDQERVAPEQRQRAMDAAARLEDVVAFGAVDHVQPIVPSGTDALGNPVTQPTEVDHHGLDARGRERVEVPFEKAAPADLDQRLRRGFRERPQAFATAGGEDHRYHRRSSKCGRQRSVISCTRKSSSPYRGARSTMYDSVRGMSGR